ncbi:uncharacterized protein EI97DRAFT_436336, partial [Westerdykella ornata]
MIQIKGHWESVLRATLRQPPSSRDFCGIHLSRMHIPIRQSLPSHPLQTGGTTPSSLQLYFAADRDRGPSRCTTSPFIILVLASRGEGVFERCGLATAPLD